VKRIAPQLEEALGYSFHDQELLGRALTHSSHVHETHRVPVDPGELAQLSNEQFEFLGDAILGFVISEELVRRFPQYGEGKLSRLKAHLVSASHLHEAAHSLGLGRYLRLGRGEELSGGRDKRTLITDALEALIAAVYLDGGLVPARRLILEYVTSGGLELIESQFAASQLDYKTALQELVRARKLAQPRYVIARERGPEHSKTFTIEVRVGKDLTAQADGYSKKDASQKAAKEMYLRMSSEPPRTDATTA
jgi:ribonuclease-3